MISFDLFGKTTKGEDVYLYTLSNEYMTVKISSYGASIVSIIVKDKNNTPCDVVLGYDNVYSYEKQNSYMGSIIGRCCNRIKNASFFLYGQKYHLSRNEQNNHLHGGFCGFDKKLWQPIIKDDKTLALTYTSPDKEEGYPGCLTTTVIYSIKNNKLFIDYRAKSTKDTICNLTNHTYFNLNGYDSGTILNHHIQVFSNKFSEDNERFLPTGKILSVENTPMNFLKKRAINETIYSDYYQIKQANGYNTNYFIKKRFDNNVVHFATVWADKSGIILKAYTDMPCFEFYTGNYLNGNALGKNDAVIENYSGFCLEPQFAPNAVNMSNVVKPILKKNKLYSTRTIYEFAK